MKIDFKQKVFNLDGDAFKGDDDKTVPLSQFCVSSLLANYGDEQGVTGEEKFKRYELASKIKDKEADVTAEEISKIKLLVGKSFAPVLVGPIYLALEGKSSEPKAAEAKAKKS